MTELLENLSSGFGQVLTLQTLGFAFLGALFGTVTGMIPGIGAITAIAILIPTTFGLDPVNSLIMLSAVYYGSMYGSSTTSILVKTPGDIPAVVMTLDGYELAKQGRAKQALATSAIGSFVAGTISTVGLMLLAPILARAANYLGAAEYFLLIVVAVTMVSSLATGSKLKSYISALFGLAIATIGIDHQSSVARFTYGVPALSDGIDFVIVAIALFAIPEAFNKLAGHINQGKQQVQKIEGAWMTREDMKRSAGPYGRGTVLGFLTGIIPGIGPSVAPFMSYGMEKKISQRKKRKDFGKGAIEGVAGPEAANNAAVGGSYIPLITMGIPGSATTALLLVIFMMYGLQPGPAMMDQNPDLVWAIIASMYIGNIMLLVLNLPLVGVFASILKIPVVPLFTGVLAFSVLGAYALRYSGFDLYILFVFGIIGCLMIRFEIPLVPAILAVVLAPLLETNLVRTMNIASGNWLVFIERPISLVLVLIIIFVVVILPLYRLITKKLIEKKR